MEIDGQVTISLKTFNQLQNRAKHMTDKQIQKRFDEAIAKFRIILDPEKTKRLIQKYIEKDKSDSHADVKNASRKVLEQITITMKAEEE